MYDRRRAPQSRQKVNPVGPDRTTAFYVAPTEVIIAVTGKRFGPHTAHTEGHRPSVIDGLRLVLWSEMNKYTGRGAADGSSLPGRCWHHRWRNIVLLAMQGPRPVRCIVSSVTLPAGKKHDPDRSRAVSNWLTECCEASRRRRRRSPASGGDIPPLAVLPGHKTPAR